VITILKIAVYRHLSL